MSGLVTHPAVGGNAHVDALEIVAESEGAGIRIALVLQEMAGAQGHDFGLVHVLPEANALVSSGNRDELIELPRLERIVGPPNLPTANQRGEGRLCPCGLTSAAPPSRRSPAHHVDRIGISSTFPGETAEALHSRFRHGHRPFSVLLCGPPGERHPVTENRGDKVIALVAV